MSGRPRIGLDPGVAGRIDCESDSFGPAGRGPTPLLWMTGSVVARAVNVIEVPV